MSRETYPHLEALREEMRRLNVDAVIIPGTDPHQSEYICDLWKLAFIRNNVKMRTGASENSNVR